MATLTTAQVTPTGTVDTLVAAAVGGDKCAPGTPDAPVWIEVLNGSGGSINVTVDSVTLSNYGADADLVVAVAAGVRKKIGPLHAQRFAGTDGLVAITYSAVTTVTVGAFRF